MQPPRRPRMVARWPSLDEARAFLALEPARLRSGGCAATGEGDAYAATEAARRLWRRCRAIDGTHLHARGLAQRGYRRAHLARLRQPAKADVAAPRKALGRVYGRAVRFGHPPPALRCSSARASRRCSRSSPRSPRSRRPPRSPPGASAPSRLRAGGARLVIARDNDAEGSQAATRPRPALRAGGLRRSRRRPRRRRLQRRPRCTRSRNARRAAQAPGPLRGR